MRCSPAVILLAVALATTGCHQQPYFVQPRAPDDVQLWVRNLTYVAVTSGYTFAYNEDRPKDPCEPTKWVYIRKDALVGTRAIRPWCFQGDTDFTIVWLRRNWADAPEPTTRGNLDEIQSLPARHPGR